MKKTLIVLLVACGLVACANGKATNQQTAASTAAETESEPIADGEAEAQDSLYVQLYNGDEDYLSESSKGIPSFCVECPYTGYELCYNMIKVEAGTFTMGATPEMENPADDEQPAHQVTITKDYYIMQEEVTQRLWIAVMGYNPSEFEDIADEDITYESRPVERVTWKQVHEFIAKLNAATGKKFRLPTEAEWEFAARGGNKSKHYQYSGSNDVDEVAWYDWENFEDLYSDEGRMFTNVKEKQPNELDLYDMSGNVWEWCSDWYGPYSSEAQTDPKGPATGEYRVVRSGGIDAHACRISTRMQGDPTLGGADVAGIGFRLALSEW